ncbi:MAG TPA: CPXCG motif-containing cysteine-rich protein [Ignavibacteria bacterium]|nr:CPXCG motif-containing cysteine-rich protein [Ignavibacteria bacterium]HMR39520.1 CPXCG motif-containing cysteine-rich protein [Ignavibacteria bacterium]
MENEIEFNCPYCGELNYADVYIAEGRSQEFINDCEVCCRPIEIQVSFDHEGIINIVLKNDDGFQL